MIKYPGGDMAFWTVLFIIAGSLVSYLAFAAGNVGLGVMFALLPVGCALIWLDVRPAKWLVAAYLSFAVVGAIALLVVKGFDTKIAVQGGLAAWGAFTFATWKGGPRSE